MTLNNRLRKLEEQSQPDQICISLMAKDEIEGKEWGDNFTDEELEQVKNKYKDQHPGKQVVFFTFKFVDDWKNA